MRVLSTLAVATALSLLGCSPSSVDEAETKKDIDWLSLRMEPAATAALGRLADNDPKALAALRARATTDVNVYIAAWNGLKRGAPWGEALLREGLSSPVTSEKAAAALRRGDPKLGPLLPALDEALAKVGSTDGNSVVASAIASLGGSAADVIERRLRDGTTRGTMCRGLASLEARPESFTVLLVVPPNDRDDVNCMRAILERARRDETTLEWMGRSAEAGVLNTASQEGGLTCEQAAKMWEMAFKSRPDTSYPDLAVPLSHILKRCPSELDKPLSNFVRSTHGAGYDFVLTAVDPFGGALASMRQFCSLVPIMARGASNPHLRGKASDTFRRGCMGGR